MFLRPSRIRRWKKFRNQVGFQNGVKNVHKSSSKVSETFLYVTTSIRHSDTNLNFLNSTAINEQKFLKILFVENNKHLLN